VQLIFKILIIILFTSNAVSEDKEKFFSLENILSGPGIEKLYEEKFERKLSSEKIISSALDGSKDALFIVENFLKYSIIIAGIDDISSISSLKKYQRCFSPARSLYTSIIFS